MSDDTQLSVIRAYLVGLYGANPQGLLWIGGHADGWKGRTFTTADAAATYAVMLDKQGGQGVYHRSTILARQPEKRGEADDSATVHYFALDIDVAGPGHKAANLPASREQAVELIYDAGFPEPTAWVHSGGGFYPQWRFTEPINVRGEATRAMVTEAFARMSAHFIAAAAERGWKLDNVRDLARVFRLPGTTNRKTDVPVVATWKYGSSRTYSLTELLDLCPPPASAAVRAAVIDDDPFDDVKNERRFTETQAAEQIRAQYAKLKAALGPENFNVPINAFAKFCSHFPWFADEERCAKNVDKALRAHGRSVEDNDYRATIASAYRSTADGRDWTAVKVETVDTSASVASGLPRLNITGTADMAYWLAAEIGQGRLSGFFSKDGRVAHTPRVGEDGYVPAAEGSDNGPAEIRPVNTEEVAAKLQFLYDCYRVVKEDKDFVEKRAIFPVEAARRVVNAPEAAAGLRPLRGITLTPMVRADGSLFDEPGYDKASGYLFLPGQGVNVPEVTGQGVEAARDLLLSMVAGFPFSSQDDRANYLGALLTPLLRLVAPPPYKMIGIGAHQPGSGKSLLAETISLIHGGVLRSEVPEDEAEWRKMTVSLLATTSAPVAVLDNVTGVLRSSVLAGLLTARGEIQDRELGSSRMIRTQNDRLWVVTGNNLSLGGDLVRRTITVMIDPDMANPETRTSFAIKDLPGWVTEHRNRLLHALLTLVAHWVRSGRPLEQRAQSDGYAAWEATVGGILAAAGIEGRFDAESGKKAAVGGDDDGLLAVLVHARESFGEKSWTVAELLDAVPAGEFIEASREWVPSVILDKLARSEPSGRKSFGMWLLFRRGRWVTGSNRSAYALRQVVSGEKNASRWSVEIRN